MSTQMITYSCSDFDRILWGSRNIVLPEDVKNLIEQITNEVGDPTYNRTPNFSKEDKSYYKKKKGFKAEVIDPNFKATIFEEKKGIEKKISGLKELINKISKKNYDKIRDQIFETINEVVNNKEETYEASDFSKLGEQIFEFSTTNTFNSHIYALLFKDLIGKYGFIKSIFDSHFTSFMSIFENINYVDPNSDYDGFCNENLKNDKRCAYSKFTLDCLKEEIVKVEDIRSIIYKLFDMLQDNMNEKDKIPIVDEIVKNLAILLIDGKPYIKDDLCFKIVMSNIDTICSTKITPDISLNNKSKFKFMDIRDALKK